MLTALLLSIVACSRTSFVYNQLDFLLPWYIGDYVDLNQAQKAYLDELLAPFLRWHRNQELPVYVEILAGIEDGLDQPQTVAGVAAVYAKLESAWLRIEDEGLGRLLDLGAQLSDAQVAGFLDALHEQQQKFEKKYLTRTDEEYYEDSYDNMVDNAEEYLGTLSDAQRELMRESSRRLLRSDRVWLQERAQWLSQLGELLKRDPNWQQRLRDAVVARRSALPPEFQRVFDHNMAIIYELIATLLNERSAAQDRHLRARIAEMRNDLEDLIMQGRQAAVSPPG